MRFFGHLVVQIASKHPYCRIRINVHVKTVPTMYITWGLRKKKFFRNLNLNANPERWNQRCFLFIQSVINAKLSLEFFHGLFINLPSLLIMKGCTILIRKKWPRWIFCFGDKTCIMKDSFIIRRCNYSGLHCIHSSKFNIQRRLYCLTCWR